MRRAKDLSKSVLNLLTVVPHDGMYASGLPSSLIEIDVWASLYSLDAISGTVNDDAGSSYTFSCAAGKCTSKGTFVPPMPEGGKAPKPVAFSQAALMPGYAFVPAALEGRRVYLTTDSGTIEEYRSYSGSNVVKYTDRSVSMISGTDECGVDRVYASLVGPTKETVVVHCAARTPGGTSSRVPTHLVSSMRISSSATRPSSSITPRPVPG